MNQIGRYQITGELGHGGMAQVYRAYDPRFERDVAIKMMAAPFLRDQSFRRRFEREAKLIASLEHPAIVPVYDFGEQNSQPYLVMRLMAGGSLVERLLKGPFSLAEAAQLLTRLAPALDVAHSSGIVHRDLKPANILFDQHHNAYISDFGIAKLINQTSMGLSQSGIMGTPAYMSPEQVRGEKLDGRSDIYALGVILFQILSGQLPYDADTPFGLAYKHVTEPIPSLLAVRPDLPQACQTVIMRAMAKDRSQRYTTAKEMADALNAYAMGQHAAHHHLSHPSREVPVLPTAARGRYRERPVKHQTGTLKRWWPYLAVLASTIVLLVGVGIMTAVMISDRETITPTTIVLNDSINSDPEKQPSDSSEPTTLPIAPTATQMPSQTAVEATSTRISTQTPVPPIETTLPTSTLVPSPTETSVPPPTETPQPAPTEALIAAPTDTPVPLPSSTPVPLPTNTPLPLPTNTPLPPPTNTPLPPPTNTPLPPPTNTLVPPPTNTLVPLLTSTPVPPAKEVREIAAGKPTIASSIWQRTPSHSFPSSNVVDRRTDELDCNTGIGGGNTYWLLADHQTGWVQVDLQQIFTIVKLRWLNTDNGGCADRATIRFHIALSQTGTFAGEEQVVHYGTMAFSTSPEYQEFILSEPVEARYVRFYVDEYYDWGGGLNELEVYAEITTP